MNNMIVVNNVSFNYPREQDVLENISVDIRENEWLSILGGNGSGKSTFVKLLCGIFLTDRGTIQIGQSLFVNEENLPEIHKKIAIVFQNPDHQIVGVTVEDDVAFGLENICIEHDEMLERISEVLHIVGLSEYKKVEPHKLSGGQKQRLAIASAIAVNPDVLILDEATTMLDPVGKREVYELVKRLQQEHGMTIISVTHDMDEAIQSDRILVFHEGEIAYQGSPDGLFNQPNKLIKYGLSNASIGSLNRIFKESGYDLKKNHYTIESVVKELWESNLKK